VQDSRAATLCHARGSSSLPARLRRHRVEAQKLALPGVEAWSRRGLGANTSGGESRRRRHKETAPAKAEAESRQQKEKSHARKPGSW